MTYRNDRPGLSLGRLGLWLLNIPVVLADMYLFLYSLGGLWHPKTPIPLWLWAMAQPAIALIAFLASSAKLSDGATRTGNRLLLVPLASLIAWILAMQVWMAIAL